MMLLGLLEVLAACLYPGLVNNDSLSADVGQRAQRILGECAGGSVGMILCAIFTIILINFRFAVTRTWSIAKVKKHEHESIMCKPKVLSSCAVEGVHSNAAILQSLTKCKDLSVN